MKEIDVLESILAELEGVNERLDALLAFQVIDHEEDEETHFMDGTPIDQTL